MPCNIDPVIYIVTDTSCHGTWVNMSQMLEGRRKLTNVGVRVKGNYPII